MARYLCVFRMFCALIINLSCVIPVAAQSPAPNELTDAPAQPSGLRAFHRSGQTFLTWQERPDIAGESYRVYRYNQPITAANLAEAVRLYEVPEGSARFFANRYYSYDSRDWRYRYVERLVVEDGGEPLPPGTGLLVWTLAPEDFGGGTSGSGYYAVTTVYNGTENTLDLGPGNTFGPLAEAVADPRPIEVPNSIGPGWHVFIQYMDLRAWNPTFHAPNSTNGYYGLDAADFEVAHAIQYAYDYAVFVPGAGQCGGNVPTRVPVIVELHAWGGNSYGPPSPRKARPWCAYQIFPVDESETWWFGFARNIDYRQSNNPKAGDAIVNYTEQRVLRMIYDLYRFPLGPEVDLDRVYVYGHSMGASGALAMALRYPNVFAAAYASKPMTNYRQADGWKGTVTPKWGSETLNLPVTLDGPGGWAAHLAKYNGTGVWDWQNHQATLHSRQGEDMAPLGISQGINDTSIPWETQGAPMLVALEDSRQVWAERVMDNNHAWDEFLALPPTLGKDAAYTPFYGLRARRSETIPGLGRLSSNPTIPPTTTASYNQSVEWSASWNAWDGPPLDTPSSWQISLRPVGEPITLTVDVTLRRVQTFRVLPGALYRWENWRLADGQLVASGTVMADETGLLSVPGICISPSGNRVRVYSQIHRSTCLPLLFSAVPD